LFPLFHKKFPPILPQRGMLARVTL